MAKKKFDFKTMGLKDIPAFLIALIKGETGSSNMITTQTGKYEINLVPDVKLGLIHAQKVRNLVFFGCIVVLAATLTGTSALMSIKAGQDITANSQDNHMKNLSSVITGYKELPDFLTIQNQLKGISDIEQKNKVLSRVFMLINSILPHSSDTVKFSELSINLDTSTLSFDAQANAGGTPPFIDYRVLESFMKRTNLMSFDYGRYVDKDGNQIPSRCISEYDASGNMYTEDGSIYAIWHRGNKGCDPTRKDFVSDSSDTASTSTTDSTTSTTNSTDTNTMDSTAVSSKVTNTIYDGTVIGLGVITTKSDTSYANGNNLFVANVVPDEKIYRTPQFTKWYKGEVYKTSEDGIGEKKDANGKWVTDQTEFTTTDSAGKVSKLVYNVADYKYTPSMELDGSISGIPHFVSKCITYTGTATKDSSNNDTVTWSADNQCTLVPDGINVSTSSNGRDQDGNLVLSFSASISLNPAVFAYNNKHVIAIGPNGQNVTDSYVQLEKMFTSPATACDTSDTECNNNTQNKTGE